MILVAFLLASACPATKMINQSKLPWVEWDYKEMKYCQDRVLYKDVNLKKFYNRFQSFCSGSP